MSVYLLTIVAAFVVAVGGAARVGLPALEHWKHHRCLVRTAVLEHELGIPLTNPELLPRPKVTPQSTAAQKLHARTQNVAAKLTPRNDGYRPMWRRY